MSLCVVFMNHKEIMISADTRVSGKTKNGIDYIINNDYSKIKIIHDKIIFGAGDKQLINRVWEAFKNQKDKSIEKLQKITIELEKEFVNFYGKEYIKKYYTYPAGKMTICLTIACFENGRPVIYNINSYDNFKINKTIYQEENNNQIKVQVSGANLQQVFDYIMTNASRGVGIQLLQETYNKFSDEHIGGYLHVYRITDKGIHFEYKNKIKDNKKLRYEKDIVKDFNIQHCIATNAKIQGVIESSEINGGTINGSTINTTKDIYVGDNIYLNATTYNSKGVYFTPDTFIKYAGLVGMYLESDSDIRIMSGGDTLISSIGEIRLVSYNSNVILPYDSYLGVVTSSNRIVIQSDLDGYLTSRDVYTKTYIDSNFADIDHTHDTRYLRPYYSANRCHIDYSEDLKRLYIRPYGSKDAIGYIQIEPL